MDLLQEYRWRGMLHDHTEGAPEAFAAEPLTAYIGFDPTAPSLHVGSLLPIMGLVHLQRAGHHPVALVGGGTGLIGDPSGKTEERKLLTKEETEVNLAGIRGQLERFLDFETPGNPARIVNNLDWLGEFRFLDFLRDVGKHFSVNALVRKETVRRRLEDDESGISYTEFSYILLQAYDFLELFDRFGCRAQLGGSDQWGNITAGIDLIRRTRGERAYGAVVPLVTTRSGGKFGKTEEGTIWLDPERTSPFKFYQFWLNVDDADVGRYLRYFSLMAREEVEELEEATRERPRAREAQKALAREVTERVHGREGLDRAQAATGVLFGGGEVESLTPGEIEEVFEDVPSGTLSRMDLEGDGRSLVEILAETGLTRSRGEARRALEQGGVYLNNRRETNVQRHVTLEDAVAGSFLVLRKGKKSYHLVRIQE